MAQAEMQRRRRDSECNWLEDGAEGGAHVEHIVKPDIHAQVGLVSEVEASTGREVHDWEDSGDALDPIIGAEILTDVRR